MSVLNKNNDLTKMLKTLTDRSNKSKIEEGILGDLLAVFKSPEALTDQHRKIVTKFWRNRTIRQMKIIEKELAATARVTKKLRDPEKNPSLYKQLLEMTYNAMSEMRLLITFMNNWERRKVPQKVTGLERLDMQDAAREARYTGEPDEEEKKDDDDDKDKEEVEIREIRRRKRKA